MKKIIFIFLSLFCFSQMANGATCTLTTRTNYTNGQTLTSAGLNADFNQLVTKVNSLDGGCVTDGSLEASALNTSEFAAVTNGIHQGCALAVSDANTISVGKCILSVNGKFVKTSLPTTQTWGCSGCASELNSTLYYVYAKADSIGTTLNLLFLTTVPGADGYDGSGNKVLGKFYNTSSGSIRSPSSWGTNQFANTTVNAFEAPIETFVFFYSPCTTLGTCSGLTQIGNYVTSITRSSTAGVFTVNFTKAFSKIICNSQMISAASTAWAYGDESLNSDGLSMQFTTFIAAGQADAYGTVSCWGY